MIVLEFEKMLNAFTTAAIVIMVLCAFVAACFKATAKARSNITGERPKIAGETLRYEDCKKTEYFTTHA